MLTRGDYHHRKSLLATEILGGTAISNGLSSDQSYLIQRSNSATPPINRPKR